MEQLRQMVDVGEEFNKNGKGRIIAFSGVPITNKLMESFPIYFGEKAKDLKGEGNYYFDKTK
jgi:hypothetical protein